MCVVRCSAGAVPGCAAGARGDQLGSSCIMGGNDQ